MNTDSLFSNYYGGHWRKLSSILEEQVRIFAESGNLIRLSRAFSYYGAVNLMLSNEFLASTLLKQIRAEYRDAGEDPRLKASYARLLALYHSFYGPPDDASMYYEEASSSYRQTDWYLDEAVTLLESVYWHYLFQNDGTRGRAMFYNLLIRLEMLNLHLNRQFDGDLLLLNSISQKDLSAKINALSPIAAMEIPYPKSCSIMAKILISFLSLRDNFLVTPKNDSSSKSSFLIASAGFPLIEPPDCPIMQILKSLAEVAEKFSQRDFYKIDGMMPSLMAKTELFKHPWYKDQINHLNSFFGAIWDQQNSSAAITSPRMRQDSLPADGISINLFEKFHVSCRNIDIDSDALNTKMGNELLLYLVTRNNLQTHKEELAEQFFPDEPVEKSFNRLYVNIHRLNKSLQGHFKSLGASSIIFIKQGVVCLNTDVLKEIDTQKYRKILSVAHQLWTHDKDASVDLMNQAVAMYSSNIAPGFYYHDWLDEYRLDLKNLQIKALTMLLQYYRDQHHSQACAELFSSLIKLAPLNEDIYVAYLKYLLEDGRKVEAFHLYCQFETRLRKELELIPSPTLKGLMAGIGKVGP